MLKLLACETSQIGDYAVSDAKDSSVRFRVSLEAETDHGQACDYIVMMDGMGSISMGLTILRLLVETNTPRRLALFSVSRDIAPLVDAWENERLAELKASGRLWVSAHSDTTSIMELAENWSNNVYERQDP